MNKISIVEFFTEHSGYKCGYCKSENTNFSRGMWAHDLSVTDYQDLIDRGWRRSGKYVYKPTMDKTCCPQYVIKCAAMDFKLNKSHKKIIKRNHKYFINDIQPSDKEMDHSKPDCHDPTSHQTDLAKSQPVCMQTEREESSGARVDSEQCQPAASRLPSTNDEPAEGTGSGAGNVVGNKKAKTVQKGAGPDPDKPPCKKAKQKRLERRLQKMSEKSSAAISDPPMKQKLQCEAKNLEDHLNTLSPSDKHKLEVRLVRSSPRSPLFNKSFEESYNVYKRYQITIHKDPPDKPTQSQYTRFLVDSPLKAEHGPSGISDGFGSFHQQYLLDGKIIAVGVLDILPRAVSSVYLYYDPHYSFLSLGIYSALRELAFVRQLHTVQPSIEYYYMGFYIHSCPKMKYKGQFHPSFLVCPETYHWVPIEQCRPKLDAAKYSRLASDDKEDEQGRVDINEVMCLHQRQPMPYMIYKALNPTARDAADVEQYASLVGATCAKRILLYRPAVHDDSD